MLFPRNHIQRDTATSTVRDQVEKRLGQGLKTSYDQIGIPVLSYTVDKIFSSPPSFEACECQETVQQTLCEGHNKIVIFSQGIKILV